MASWIRLSIEITERGLEISVRDSTGQVHAPEKRFERSSRATGMQWRFLSELRKKRGRGGGIWVPENWPTAPTPIFVDPPAKYAHLDWELIARGLARRYWRTSVPVARYVPPAAGLRDPFRLPLTLITLGQTRTSIRAFERHNWVQQAIQWKGIAIQHVPAYGSLQQAMSGGVNAIVCDDYRLPNVLHTVGSASLSSRPELILSWPTQNTAPGRLDVPSGTTVYQLPSATESRLARAIDIGLQGLVRVEPLVSLPERAGIGGIVYCGPDTMGGSRFHQVTEQVEREADYVEALARAMELVDPEAFDFEKVLGNVQAARQATMETDPAGALIVPMSRTMSELRASATTLAAQLPVTLKKEERARLSAQQQRRVDLALRRVDPVGGSEYVPKGARLDPETDYRLCVQIGQAFRESLLAVSAPPIDPLLPQRRAGHRLTAALFPKNIRTKGPRVRPLFLPEFGPSRQVSFGIQTPAKYDALEARIGIYYGNQLLQNYLFVTDESGTRVTLQFSQTAKFKNLDRLGRRALSLSMNEDADGQTHSIMLFKDGRAKRFAIPTPVMKTATDGFWAFLKEATGSDPSKPRFSTYPNAGDPVPREFHTVLRQAIDLGNELYRGLQKDAEQLTNEFASLRGQSDVPIQIARLHRNYVFPWAVFYDWHLPHNFEGTVCTGWADGKECDHRADSKVYCANGFWGVRHVLEERIGGREEAEDAELELSVEKRRGAILLAADQENDDLTKLQEELPALLALLGPGEDLLQKVWDAEAHPAITIIYGHTETEEKNGRRIPKRITLPDRKWLSTLAIDQQTDDAGELGEPRPVILLLACDTALIDVGTLNDFVSSFHHARAAVIVGTESVAFRSLLARFAREMTVALAAGTPLGIALRDFRRKMIVAGNPIPFVFHAVGSADFQVKWKEE